MRKSNMNRSAAVVVGAVVLLLGAAVEHSTAAPSWPKIEELDEAEVFFEENTTDGDMGLHLKTDGEAWQRIMLFGPKSRLLVNVSIHGGLKKIGLTELFSESAEPGYDELPRQDFLDQFREGTYRYVGLTSDGTWLIGETELTKDIPGAPILNAPAEDAEVPAEQDLVIQWTTLADPNPPDSVIEFYEVVVEKDEDDERLRVFTVHMLPADTSVRVPAEFLEAGKDYKVEIVAQETSGNRAAVEVPFSTED